VSSLANVLKINTRVTSVQLWEVPICKDGAESLADVLRENTTITELLLWVCMLQPVATARLPNMTAC
jgi:hypothetical protein